MINDCALTGPLSVGQLIELTLPLVQRALGSQYRARLLALLVPGPNASYYHRAALLPSPVITTEQPLSDFINQCSPWLSSPVVVCDYDDYSSPVSVVVCDYDDYSPATTEQSLPDFINQCSQWLSSSVVVCDYDDYSSQWLSSPVVVCDYDDYSSPAQQSLPDFINHCSQWYDFRGSRDYAIYNPPPIAIT
jgi:hypothetical protein